MVFLFKEHAYILMILYYHFSIITYLVNLKNLICQPDMMGFIYSLSCNQRPPISHVLIG